MKPGHVISMRVSPRNCMAVLDLLRMADVPLEGMSFSAACSRALDLAMSGLIKAGQLPERDGFEYSEMMAPFGLGTTGRTARDAQSARVASMFEGSQAAENRAPVSAPGKPSVEDAKRGLRELLGRYEGPDGEQVSTDEWSEEDQKLYNTYLEVIYG